MKARMALLALLAVTTAACGGGDGSTTGEDPVIEHRVGYAVIVNDFPTGLEIGFSPDRDSESGEAFDVSAALWRVEDGAWNEPPVSCIGKGQRLDLGITSVQEESRPGLLKERVVLVTCLAPTDG